MPKYKLLGVMRLILVAHYIFQNLIRKFKNNRDIWAFPVSMGTGSSDPFIMVRVSSDIIIFSGKEKCILF